MTVYFIGAGPGAADLLTVRAAELISRCRTCLFAGSIVPAEVLSSCPTDAHIVNTARMPLSAILDEIVRAHERGEDVARLHSGDTSIYSALDEQKNSLDELGIDWEIVPGVPAFAAAAAQLGIELTIPGVSQSVILTRVDGRSTPMPIGENLASICATGATAVIHLAAAQADRVARELIPVYGENCPVAVVAHASRPEEVQLRCTLSQLPTAIANAGIARTAVILVGQVLQDRPLDSDPSFLYSDSRPRDEMGRTLCDTPLSAVSSPTNSTGENTGSEPPGAILILGGTSEGRRLADLFHTAGIEVTTSLAGRISRPKLPSGQVRIGGFGGPTGLRQWLIDNRISAVIDATHPFAEKISASAVAACTESETALLRVHRREWEPQERDTWIRVASNTEAAAVVRSNFKRPMLTIGRQGLAAFAGDTRGSYLIRCVEPPSVPLPHRYLLVLDRGPFSIESERTLMSRHKIDVLVTKNSGGSATAAKLEAARDLRIPVVMIDRPSAPQAETVHTVEDAAQWIVNRFGRRSRPTG